jgi:hypothetical protein
MPAPADSKTVSTSRGGSSKSNSGGSEEVGSNPGELGSPPADPGGCAHAPTDETHQIKERATTNIDFVFIARE